MTDHLVLYVNRLINSKNVIPDSSGEPSSTNGNVPSSSAVSEEKDCAESSINCGVSGEEEPLIQLAECRICQEEDHVNNLESPCACNGSLKFAHRKCVQRWCNEKGDTTCEICHQTYKPGYSAPPPSTDTDDTVLDINGGWTISGVPLNLHDPRLFAMAAAERHFLDSDYDDYAGANASGAAFCRSIALILMALLLLRHAVSMTTATDDDDDHSAFFSMMLLRAAGFLLPFYIIAWAISILQRRRQRQVAATLAAAEIALMLRSAERRGLQLTVSQEPAPILHQESTSAPHPEPFP